MYLYALLWHLYSKMLTDTCPQFWTRNGTRCFKFVSKARSWAESEVCPISITLKTFWFVINLHSPFHYHRNWLVTRRLMWDVFRGVSDILSTCCLSCHQQNFNRNLFLQLHCLAIGGNLASVHSIDEYSFIQELIREHTEGTPRTWIGGCDAAQVWQLQCIHHSHLSFPTWACWILQRQHMTTQYDDTYQCMLSLKQYSVHKQISV